MAALNRIYIFSLQLGILVFPSYFLLDMAVYPNYKYPLFIIRAGVTLYLLIMLFLFQKGYIKQRFIFTVVFLSFLLVAFAISLMCFIAGDGFASPYYAGLIQLILVSTLFFTVKPKHYALIMAGIIAEHFTLLAFIPWEYKDLLINIFAVGIIAIIGMLVHNFIYMLVEEITALKGILPICANCKKIRDDKGYWHQVEAYLSTHSTAEFSHGICPECQKVLYPEFF